MNYFREANALYVNEKFTDAIELYTKSIDADINKVDSLYNCAVCHIKLKNFDTAIKLLFDVLEYGNESKYYFNLAYCYMSKKDYQSALRHFNTAWSLDDSDIECEKAIDLILKQYKKKKSA